MKPLTFTPSLAAAAFALAALAAAPSAHARSDVYFSIGVQTPGFYVQPAPVYGNYSTYYAPAPPPIYYQHHGNDRRYETRHWQGRSPYGDRDRDGFANIYDHRGSHPQWRQGRVYGPYGDLDRDGVVNRQDRDRDGDGVRNRYDRSPNNPYRR
jgi:hypothetical protein